MYKLRAPEDFTRPYNGTFMGYDVNANDIIEVPNDYMRRFFKRLSFEDVDFSGNKSDINKLLIIMQGGAGDTLFATPGIKALKEQRPEVEIFIATWNIGNSLIKNNPYIDNTLATISSELSLHYADFDEVIDFSRVIDSASDLYPITLLKSITSSKSA